MFSNIKDIRKKRTLWGDKRNVHKLNVVVAAIELLSHHTYPIPLYIPTQHQLFSSLTFCLRKRHRERNGSDANSPHEQGKR